MVLWAASEVAPWGDWVLTSGRGQYSDAVLNELESQNDKEVEGILGKVRVLKDVSGQVPIHSSVRACRTSPADSLLRP